MSGYVQPWLNHALETLLSADFDKAPVAAMPRASEFAGYRFPQASSASSASVKRSKLPQSPAVIIMRALSDSDAFISDGKWFIFTRFAKDVQDILHNHGWGRHAKGCIFMCDEYDFVSLPQAASPVADIGLLVSKVTVVAGGVGIGLDEGDSANAITNICDSPLLRARWRDMKLSQRMQRAPLLDNFDPQAPELQRHMQVGISGLNSAQRPPIQPLDLDDIPDMESLLLLARKLRFGTRSAPPPLEYNAPPAQPPTSSAPAQQVQEPGAQSSTRGSTSHPAAAGHPAPAAHECSSDSHGGEGETRSPPPALSPASQPPSPSTATGGDALFRGLPELSLSSDTSRSQRQTEPTTAAASASAGAAASSQSAVDTSDERLLAMAVEAAMHDPELDSDDDVAVHGPTLDAAAADGGCPAVYTQASQGGGGGGHGDDDDWDELVGGGSNSQSPQRAPPASSGMAAALRGAQLPRRSAPTQTWGAGGHQSPLGGTPGDTSGDVSAVSAGADSSGLKGIGLGGHDGSSIPLGQASGGGTTSSGGAAGGASNSNSGSHSDPSVPSAILHSVSVDIVSGTLSSESHPNAASSSSSNGARVQVTAAATHSAGGTLSTIVSHSSGSGRSAQIASQSLSQSESPPAAGAAEPAGDDGGQNGDAEGGASDDGGQDGDAEGGAVHNTSSGSGSTGHATATSTSAACSQERDTTGWEEAPPPQAGTDAPPQRGEQEVANSVAQAHRLASQAQVAMGVMNDTLTSSDTSGVSTPLKANTSTTAKQTAKGGQASPIADATPPPSAASTPQTAPARNVSFSFVAAGQMSMSPPLTAEGDPPLPKSPLGGLAPSQSPIPMRSSQPDVHTPHSPGATLDATQLLSQASTDSESSEHSNETDAESDSQGEEQSKYGGSKRSRDEQAAAPAALARVDTDGFVVPPPKKSRGESDESHEEPGDTSGVERSSIMDESQVAVFSQEQQGERSLVLSGGTPLKGSPEFEHGQAAHRSPFGDGSHSGGHMRDSFSRNELFGIVTHTQDSQLDQDSREEQAPPAGNDSSLERSHELSASSEGDALAAAAHVSLSLAQPTSGQGHASSPETSPAEQPAPVQSEEAQPTSSESLELGNEDK